MNLLIKLCVSGPSAFVRDEFSFASIFIDLGHNVTCSDFREAGTRLSLTPRNPMHPVSLKIFPHLFIVLEPDMSLITEFTVPLFQLLKG